MAYEIVGFQSATKAEGASVENIAGRTFATREEAQQFVQKEGRTSSLKTFANRFGYGNAEIRETEAPTPKTFTSQPLSERQEERRREGRILQQQRLAEQGIEKAAQGQQVSGSEREAIKRFTGKSPQEAAKEAIQRSDAQQGYVTERGAVPIGMATPAPTRGKELFTQFESIKTGARGEIRDGRYVSSDRGSYGPQKPTTDFRREPSVGETPTVETQGRYDPFKQEERGFQSATVSRATDKYGPVSKQQQRTEREYFLEQAAIGGDKKAMATLVGYEAVGGVVKAGKQLPSAAAFAAGAAFLPGPTAVVGVYAGIKSIRPIQEEISQKGLLRTAVSEAPTFALYGASGKLGGKYGPKLTGSTKYAKFSSELSKESGFGLPRPKFTVTAKEVPKGQDIAIATTIGEGKRITTIEYPFTERVSKRRTIPRVQKSIGIEATKEDVVKLGVEDIGASKVNIIQVGKGETVGYLQSGVLRGKEFGKFSDVFNVKKVGTPTAETRATVEDITTFESFNLIFNEPKNKIAFAETEARVGMFGKGFPKLMIEKGTATYQYFRSQFSRKSTPSGLGGVESTSLFKGKLVRFPRTKKVGSAVRPKEKGYIDADKVLGAAKSDEALVGGIRVGEAILPVTQSPQQLAALEQFKLSQAKPTVTKQVLSYEVKSQTAPLVSVSQAPKTTFYPSQKTQTQVSFDYARPTQRLPTAQKLSISQEGKQRSGLLPKFDVGYTTRQSGALETLPRFEQKPTIEFAPKIDVRTRQDTAVAFRLDTRQRTQQKTRSRRDEFIRETTDYGFPRRQKISFKYTTTTKRKKSDRTFRGPPTVSAILTGQGTKLTRRQVLGKAFISPFQTRRV